MLLPLLAQVFIQVYICNGTTSCSASIPSNQLRQQDLSLQREIDGRTYYEFEFATKANTYIRHALAVVTVANGKMTASL